MAIANRPFFIVAKIAKSQSTGLYTHICSNETHKIEKSLEPEGAADDAFYQQPFKTRHLACHASRQAKRDRAILGICRRFYHEGSYILWATNTFIFEDSSALEAFTAFVNRPNNTDIRQNLRKICLSATLSGIKKDQLLKDLDYLVLSDNLNVAKPILSAFKYIKTLEIWADYMPGSRTTAAATSEPRTREEALEEKERPIKEALGVLQPFRRLGLRYARLVLTDNDGDLYRKKGIASERLTWQEKNDLAAECGRELLDRVEESERGGKEDMEVLEQGKEVCGCPWARDGAAFV